jgi:hypothetical protein
MQGYANAQYNLGVLYEMNCNPPTTHITYCHVVRTGGKGEAENGL